MPDTEAHRQHRGARNRGRKHNSALREIIENHRGRVAGLVLVSFVAAGLEAGLLVLMTALAVTLASGASTVGPYLGVFLPVGTALLVGVGLLLLRVGLGLGSVLISTKMVAQVTVEQRQRLSHAYLCASWEVQSVEPPGRLQELLTSFVGRATLTVQAFTGGLTSLLSLAAFLSISFILDVRSSLAAAAVLVVVGALLVPLRRAIRRMSAKWTSADVAFAGSVAELGALGREMQTFGVRSEFIHTIDGLSSTATNTQRRAQAMNALQSQLYVTLAYAAILGGIGLSASSGLGDVTTMGTILLLMLRSLSYGQSLASASASIAAYSPFLESVRELVIDYERRPAMIGSSHPVDPLPIAARNVYFEYSSDASALENVAFSIDPGEVVGVIGPSGSGKSTLAQLLLGLRTPTRGHIEVGGMDLSEVDRAWWTKNTSFVPQDALLISGSVADNIRFFREGVDEDELVRVADMANILKDIQALPHTFATDIGARGSQLSGGQRQRVSIARALVGRPRFLVMDEPTSALDTESERLVRDSIAKLKGETAILLIAHRMSTIEACDKVLVIEDGKVTGDGAPSELLKTNSFYRRAVSLTEADTDDEERR